MKAIFKLTYLSILTISILGTGLLFSKIDENISFTQNSKLNISLSEDSSGISADGPYVFYRGDSIIIKSIILDDTGYTFTEETAFNKNEVELKCSLEDESPFRFNLNESLNIQQSIYPLPEKILAVSDIEGNFRGFKLILEGSGVIDKDYNWIFGNGHLVLVGDFFDRGLNVTEVLWLIYKLEQEAEKAGGKVHFILGNHEIMNLYGNVKYVRNKYIENTNLMNLTYMDLFSENTELGRWLRTKNVIEKIGDIVFVHGGISPELAAADLSFEEINNTARKYIGKKKDAIDSENGKLINSSSIGPFWYRGFVKQELTQQGIDSIMNYLEADKIIVGHSLVEKITPFYNNCIIAIDLDHSESIKENKMFALWIENGVLFTIDNNGDKIILIQ